MINRSLDLDLGSAQPDGQRAARVHQHLRDRLVESTIALLRSAQKGLAVDCEYLIERCARLDTGRTFSPGAFVAHYALLAGLNRGDAHAVHTSLNDLDKFTDYEWYLSGLTIGTVGTTFWETPVLDLLSAHPVPDRFGRMTIIEPLPKADLAHCSAELQEALALIEATDPQMRAEVDEYVRHVCLSRGSGITGATSLQFFGAVFLREPYPEYHRVMYFFEHLIHETSHLNLNVVHTIDQLVLNPPDELHQSPLRRDPRPLMGIFHAQFVLSRLVYMYRRVQPLVSDPIFASHAGTIEEKFRRGLATLNSAGRFTEAGRELLDSMNTLAK